MVFFTASDITHGAELWKSDGTEAGTSDGQRFRPRQSASSGLRTSDKCKRHSAFFVAYDAINGQELWKSDGTAAGTVMVKDIIVGAGSSSPENLTNVNGTLFFSCL